MQTLHNVQKILKQFGTVIYTGDRLADLELMQDELKELLNNNMLQPDVYAQAVFILRKETSRLKEMGEENT